ncbi:MAG: hypothetical protein HY904_19640, partial [Deltaproteobacteria bacterium]|nr:hypothetical protein [Deltaproteobacteria bacterium]
MADAVQYSGREARPRCVAGLRGILLVLVCAVAPGPAAGQGFPAAPPVVRRVPAGPDTGLVPVVPPPGDWVEEPREVPVDPAVAESLARVAVRGGHGAAGPWLLLGGARWGPALAAWGA